MSNVTKLDCVFCTPSAGDLQGIRRPIAGGITSEELARLIKHIIIEHTPELERVTVDKFRLPNGEITTVPPSSVVGDAYVR